MRYLITNLDNIYFQKTGKARPSPFFYLLILSGNKMQTICVTGGIAMGKTTVMNTLSELFPEAVFFDADKVVSGLLTTSDFRVKLSEIFGDKIKKVFLKNKGKSIGKFLMCAKPHKLAFS